MTLAETVRRVVHGYRADIIAATTAAEAEAVVERMQAHVLRAVAERSRDS